MCKNTSNASSSRNPSSSMGISSSRSLSSSKSFSSSRSLAYSKRNSSSRSYSSLPDTFNTSTIQEERLVELRQYLREMFDNLVLPECSKSFNSDAGSQISVPEEVLVEIIDTLIQIVNKEKNQKKKAEISGILSRFLTPQFHYRLDIIVDFLKPLRYLSKLTQTRDALASEIYNQIRITRSNLRNMKADGEKIF